MIRDSRTWLGVGVAWVLCGALGCTTPTYVNIPAQPSDIARNDPNASDVVELMVLGLEAALSAEGGLDDRVYEVLLPSGSSQATYERVVLELGGGAITPDTLRREPVPSVQVAGVRVRNRDAFVDVVRPSPTGRSAVTVELFLYLGEGWFVQRVQKHRLSPAELGCNLTTDAPQPVPAGGAGAPVPGGPADPLDLDAPVLGAPVSAEPAEAVELDEAGSGG